MSDVPKPPKPKWEWKRGPGHDEQPLIEWYREQFAIQILMKVGMRAIKRKDRQTFDRIAAVMQKGADEEQLAAMRKP